MDDKRVTTKPYITRLFTMMILMSAENHDLHWRGILIFLFSACTITGWHSFHVFRGMISFRQYVCQRTCLATKRQKRPLNTVNYSTKQWSFKELMAQFRASQQFLHPNSNRAKTQQALKQFRIVKHFLLFLKGQFIQICKLCHYLLTL